MISSEFLDQKASSSQIDRYTIIREYIQLLFLRYFYEYKKPGVKTFFKGGTAIRFLFNSFRFSEDLDFTSIGAMADVEKILKDILPELETESGFRILIKDEKTFKEIGAGYRLVLQRNQFIRQPLGIRLDFSFREKPIESEVSSIAVHDYPISPFPLVIHLSKKEILAEKVRALLVRGKPRDLFDLWFLLKQKTKLEWEFVIKKMEYYPDIEINKRILEEKIQEFEPEEFRKDLNQFLPSNYRRHYANIIKEACLLIKE